MKKILIVEDDNAIAGLYNIVFSKQHYSVEIARDGEEAMTKVKSFVPDMILLDIMMPKMNGLQVLQKLKANQEFQHIPVIVLSNLTEVSTEGALMQAGAVMFVVKSHYLPGEIVTLVDEYFSEAA